MLICHEAIWVDPQESPWYDGPGPDEIASNRVRRTLLDRHGMVVYRSHSNWDALRVDGVADQAVAVLGFRDCARCAPTLLLGERTARGVDSGRPCAILLPNGWASRDAGYSVTGRNGFAGSRS